MTKQQTLEVLMLLSALESWGFTDKHPIPCYLHDRLGEAIDLLRNDILEGADNVPEP